MVNHAKMNGTAAEKPLLHNRKPCTKPSCQHSHDSSQNSSWNGFRRKCRLLWPHVWPKDDRRLQITFVASFIILCMIRGISLLAPIFYKMIVDSFSDVPTSQNSPTAGTLILMTSSPEPSGQTTPPPEPPFRWDYIIVYVFLVSMKGPGGYLTAVRNVLWIRVHQHAAGNLRIALFEHLHSLSQRWHLSRKTGEVLQVMDRGVQGVTHILNITSSQLLPVVADITIAIVYFFVAFDQWVGFIVTVTMVVYAGVAVLLSEWRAKYRRALNVKANEKSATVVDSMLNFETVKVFAAEKWEVNKYAEAIYEHQSAEWWVHATANLYGSLRVTVMNAGFLAGSLVTAYYVTKGRFTAGDYVMYASYVMQLYEPLNMLGSYYRLLQQSFIDMEHMFDMFDEEPEVTDKEDASHMLVSGGQVEFKNVTFSYSESQPVLKNVNFVIPPGKTVALVGESGSGKSTIARLLFRLYDIQSGAVTIDGQNIATVTQNSLRKALGIVPQDTALFHTDVCYNIRYGTPHALDAEVIEAARAADIHDTITSLPEGYQSRIGERGFKLSGGERQRVAIARMLLKASKITVLDEATSALDSKSERYIQRSLWQLCEARTCLMIAHRLSTVVHADQILVLKQGRIVERGRHSELLSYGGLYASMWMEQLQMAQQPAKCRSLPSFSKANKTSTPTSLRHAAGALSMTGSVISEESRDSDGDTHPFDLPITDVIVTADDNYRDYQETPPDGVSLTDKLEPPPTLPTKQRPPVWPRRMSKSLVNLNPHESDTSRLHQGDESAGEHGRKYNPRLEHSISMCDAFNVNCDSEVDVREEKPPDERKSPWTLLSRKSLDETRL